MKTPKKIASVRHEPSFSPSRWPLAFTVRPLPLYSPLIAAIIAVAPAATPPGKSPCRNRGTISPSMIRLAVTSGSAPSRP